MTTFFKTNRLMTFTLIIVLFKTFIVSIATFELTIQQLLLFFTNTLLFLVIAYGTGLFLKQRYQSKYYFFTSVLLSTILYANIVYYREFADIITLPMLSMSSNMGDLTTSIFALIEWYDLVYFIDLLIISYLLVKKKSWQQAVPFTFQQSKKLIAVTVLLTLISITYVNFLERTYSYNREQIVKTIGIYNYYLYDVLVHTKTNAQPVFSTEDDWTRIKNFLAQKNIPSNDELFARAKDMNVVVISLESVESFVIGETLNGEEITPFLNELIEESFYFENFYHQTGQGKTSDAEFLINNSLYPLGRGAVFLTHYDNEFRALPETLSNNGYYNAVFHANDKTFYNRDLNYPNLGYDAYYSFDDYEISSFNSVGWGLKDIEFFQQTVDYISQLPEPFYSTIITLTNHFPFQLDEEDHYIEPFDSNSPIVNQFFPTVRYTDEALRIFVNQLKEKGLYDNTIFVIYGDHYGIANSHYDELSTFLKKEISTFEAVKLGRVPLIIHIPGQEGKRMNTVSGQIDVMPTLLNLLGITDSNLMMFGNDLFAEDRDDFVVLRNGTIITNELIYTNDFCFSYDSGEEVPLEQCEAIRERGSKELYFSDKIIYGDLFRFNEE